MLPNLGPMEMVFVLVVLLLIFGARRLPELGSGLGKGIREFKRSMSDIREEVERPEPQPELRERKAPSQVPPSASDPAAGDS